MVPVLSLWLPVVVSAVLVFLTSSVIHMLLTYHRNDFGKLPDEDATMEALGKFNIPPGEYVVPYAGSTKNMQSPEFIEKANRGPVAFMTVMPNGIPGMGKSLMQWFAYCLLVGVFSGYIAGCALGAGAPYLAVFRFAGCTAFACYAVALLQNSIWYKRAWSVTLKSSFDGLIYALVTAGAFGWLWPAP